MNIGAADYLMALRILYKLTRVLAYVHLFQKSLFVCVFVCFDDL